MKRKLPLPAEGREQRLATFGDIEIRTSADAADPIGFRGTAAVFNSRAVIGGKYGWIEQVAPGAFSSVLGDDVRLLKNHNPDLILARTTADNLRLSQTKDGLDVDADMTPTTYARDLALSLEARDVTQMSFAFEVASNGDEWDELDEDDPDFNKTVFNEIRTITKFKRLYDVSPVTYPAYTDTEASLRMRELRIFAEAIGLHDDELHEVVSEIREGRFELERLLSKLRDPDEAVSRQRTNGESSSESIGTPPTTGPARGNRERIAQTMRKAKVA